MVINEAGLDIIRQFEECRLDAYRCPAGIWTIGYGHTGQDVCPDMVIDQAEAERLLSSDLMRFERGVDARVCVPLSSNKFSALVSFAYNVGLRAFQESTLLRLLNAGDYAAAADEFPRWNKSRGRVLRGLTRRRAAERQLFLTPGDSDAVA